MTEPVQHPMNPEQEIRLHAINLATALNKDAVFRTDTSNHGDLVLRDAERFAAFIRDGVAPVAGSQETTGAEQ